MSEIAIIRETIREQKQIIARKDEIIAEQQQAVSTLFGALRASEKKALWLILNLPGRAVR